jgi:hypothetical protein
MTTRSVPKIHYIRCWLELINLPEASVKFLETSQNINSTDMVQFLQEILYLPNSVLSSKGILQRKMFAKKNIIKQLFVVGNASIYGFG